MTCLTCSHQPEPPLRVGDRVTVSMWEKVNLGKDLRGTVIVLGDPETLRLHSAKIAWDNGHKDRWWPMNALIREPTPESGGGV